MFLLAAITNQPWPEERLLETLPCHCYHLGMRYLGSGFTAASRIPKAVSFTKVLGMV